MSTSASECQVSVVGAGPTGLVLAAQLLALGIRTRIVDKSDGPAQKSYRRRSGGCYAGAVSTNLQGE